MAVDGIIVMTMAAANSMAQIRFHLFLNALLIKNPPFSHAEGSSGCVIAVLEAFLDTVSA
jgi:hypothetical protein